MNDFDLTINEEIRPVLMGAKTAQSYYKKNSVSALARDLILQYPVLISADIPYDNAVTLSKALELQYASLQIMVLSADTAFGVDPASNAGVRDLISRYHSNNDAPNVISYAGNVLYNIGSIASALSESANIDELMLKNATVVEEAHTPEFLESLWETPLSAVESTTLNDLYNPASALIETISRVADRMEDANEAFKPNPPDPNWRPKYRLKHGNVDISKYEDDTTQTGIKLDTGGKYGHMVGNTFSFDKNTKWTSPDGKFSYHNEKIKAHVPKSSGSSGGGGNGPVNDPDGNALDRMRELASPSTEFDPRKLGDGSRYANDKSITPNGARMLKDFSRDFSKLEPTMIELEFFVRNGDNSGIRKAVIGVAAMPRAIPSDVMRANIIRALQHDSTGFKFIAWTRGEQKLVRDFIFNVSRIKEDAMAKNRYDKWFAALRKRKNNAKAFKGSRMAINPLTTIIITKNDAALIKQTSGFDLMDEKVAAKLMDSLYLLCFMVVDTDTGLVSTLLDGQQYFSETTVDHLKKSNKDKSNDLTNVREMLKLLGR